MKFLVFFMLLCITHVNSVYADSAEVTELKAGSVESSTENVSAPFAENTLRKSTIPFKEDRSMAQQSAPVITVLIVFFLIAVVFLYFFKNKLSLVNQAGGKNIQVLEIKRLNARLTLFHVKVKDNEMLIMQSGDTLNVRDMQVGDKTISDINTESISSVES